MLDGCVELSESSKSTEQKVGPDDPVSQAPSAPEETGSNSDGARIKRLFSNASIYAIGTISLQLFTAILAPVLTYFLAPAEFGIWTLSMMVFFGK